MLKTLKISNLALIEDVEIEFNKGLNILSGETGAGKSIILNSLNLLIGEQAKTELIRTGAEKTEIQAVFDISAYPFLKEYLKNEFGIETDENILIIDREITIEKASSAFVNNKRVLIQTLKSLGKFLIDIHGQHQHQSLFDKTLHLRFLDQYAGISSILKEYQDEFQKAVVLNKKLKEKLILEDEKEKIYHFNHTVMNEIREAGLKMNEEEELDEELNRLGHFQEVKDSLEKAFSVIYKSDKSAFALLQSGHGHLEKIKDKEKEVKKVLPFLQDALLKLEPVVDFLRSYKEEINFSPEKMDQVSKRLQLIKSLKKRFNLSDIQAILTYQNTLETEISKIEKNKEEIEELEKQINEIRNDLGKKALEISKKRLEAASKLEEAIENELRFLGMEKVHFKVLFEYLEDEDGKLILEDGRRVKISRDGIEKVEFLISPNLGEDLKPLIKIASGGELSRIMLSIKNILSKIDPILTLVFDEIDTGIGGETGFAVGKKLKEISFNKQVICITHLPQIASKGNYHYKVEKRENNERTITVIYALNEKQRIEEISRMLSGDSYTETSLQHAKEFLLNNT
ncbi:MAG TPA: DNA repair protein RecN [Spirochaetia bacterium]|nr:MAG: DNA repair protein RecN [Spirochaetes bacterium GWB1_36_13]HCL56584.1 DNA repair protein RecN [Spirochaetia bacterium]